MKYELEEKKDRKKRLEDIEHKYKVFWERGKVVPYEHKALLPTCIEYLKILDQETNENARLTGELLDLVKRMIPHGEFLRWIEVNCPFSARAGLNFIKLYRVTLDHPKLLWLKKSLIYLIATKNFTKKVRQMMEEAISGCYPIHYKEVLLLKTKLDSGEISEDSVELDDFFRRRKALDVQERINNENDKILIAIEKQKYACRDFLDKRKKATESKHINEYTKHCEYVIRVLDQAISELHDGYKSAEQNRVSTLKDQAQLKDAVAVDGEEGIKDCNTNGNIVIPTSRHHIHRPRFGFGKKTRGIISDLGLAPEDINCGEIGIPDEIIIRHQTQDISEIAADCYRKNTYSNNIRYRILKGVLCPDDYLQPAPGSDEYYMGILCPADYAV